MAASDPLDSNDFEEYFQLKVVENKQNCMEFFKSLEIRKNYTNARMAES